MKKLLFPLAVVLAMISSVPAWAATATTTFAVSATVQPTGTVTASPLNFGALEPGTSVSGNSSLSVNVSNGTPYSIAIDGGTTTTRLMGGGMLSYWLFQDATMTTSWGDGTAHGGTVAGVGTGAAQAFPVYGQVTALPGTSAGVYNDTVNVTITF